MAQNQHLNASYKIISILQQSKSSIEKIIDDLPDAFGIVTSTGEVVKGNSTLAGLMGVGMDHLLGSSISQLFNDNSWWLFQQNLNHLSSYTSIEFELPVEEPEGATGRKIYLWKVKKISRHAEKNMTLYFMLGSDVTILRDREIKLKHLTATLQDQVREKTKDITSLLNSIEQGIFSVNPDMTLNEAHSTHAEEIFETDDFSQLSIKDLLHLDAKKTEEFKNWYSLISSKKGLRKWNKFMMLCPIQQMVVHGENVDRVVKFEYRPVINNDVFQRMMVLASDITEQVRNLEKVKDVELRQALQTERLLGLVKSLKVSLTIFFEETEETLELLSSIKASGALASQATVLFNALHTLKGNAGSFGFHHLAALTSIMEDTVEDIIHKRCNDFQKAHSAFLGELVNVRAEVRELTELRKTLFLDSKHEITVNRDVFSKMCETLTQKKGEPAFDTLYQLMLDLDSRRFGDYCEKYNNIIKLYREQAKKNILDLINETPEVLLRRDVVSKIDGPLVHIIRNAIDHGIEDDTTRSALSKGAGRICISCVVEAEQLCIRVSDNGGGIDANKIAAKAAEREVYTQDQLDRMSDSEKFDIIFLQGFSSKSETTDTSGRGTGLDAVRTTMREQGGTVEVDSVVGRGTTFTLKCPVPKASE